MNRLSITGLGALVVLASVSLISGVPVLALREAGAKLAQIQPQPRVQLQLAAEKKVVTKEEGKEKVTWQPLKGPAVVQPGDVLRYTLSGNNGSDRPLANLAVTQPVPKGTVYVLNSARAGLSGTKITYSINNGQSFVENPTVQVKLPDGKVETRPAPAEAYTHLSWKFSKPVEPKTAVNAAYWVKVR